MVAMTPCRRFFIIGAMKAGTTSLYQWLSAHPDIYASPVKEPSFFGKDRTAAERQEYERLFEGSSGKKWAFEASTNYAKHPLFLGVPERIRSAYPDAKLIYVVRDPIQRLYSNYVHNASVGSIYRAPWETEVFRSVVKEGSQYVLNSDYSYQLDQYRGVFPADQMLVLQFEKMIADPGAALARVLRFLDLDDGFRPDNLNERYNIRESRYVPRPFARRLLPVGLMARVLNSNRLRPLAFTPAPRKNALSDPEVESVLKRLLRPGAERLASDYDVDLSLWDLGESPVCSAGR